MIGSIYNPIFFREITNCCDKQETEEHRMVFSGMGFETN